MESKRYTIGLDVGISSVGWGLIELDAENNPIRILDTGVRIFEAAETDTGESPKLRTTYT